MVIRWTQPVFNCTFAYKLPFQAKQSLKTAGVLKGINFDSIIGNLEIITNPASITHSVNKGGLGVYCVKQKSFLVGRLYKLLTPVSKKAPTFLKTDNIKVVELCFNKQI